MEIYRPESSTSPTIEPLYTPSPHHVLVYELAVEVRSDVVVHVALLLVHPLRLVLEHRVLVPSLRQAEPSLQQRIPFQQFRLPVGGRVFGLLLHFLSLLQLPLLLHPLELS